MSVFHFKNSPLWVEKLWGSQGRSWLKWVQDAQRAGKHHSEREKQLKEMLI